jgi:DNA-binding CsgD family transcriptional regulator
VELRAADLRRLVEARDVLASPRSLDDYVDQALAALAHLFPDELHGCNLVDFEAPSVRLWTNPPGVAPADSGEVLARCAGEHPIMMHAMRTRDTDVRQLADFAGADAMRGGELWARIFEPVGIDQQIAVTVWERGLCAGLTLQHDGDPYTEHDRALLATALPGFASAFSAAVSCDRLAILEHALDGARRGFVIVAPGGAVVGGSAWAIEALCGPRALATVAPRELPFGVARWVGTPRRQRHPLYLVPAGGVCLQLRASGATAVGELLELRDPLAGTRWEALALTRREAEVLAVLAAGVDPVTGAAMLGISLATFRKHQERAYRRIGASNLRAALAMVELG